MADESTTADPTAEGGVDGGTDAETVEEAGAEVEHDIDLLTALSQRDEYLALAKRLQADFENFRKRTIKQQQEEAERASGRFVEALLPVLDAFDNAVIHGIDGVGPIHKTMLDALAKLGLEVIPTDGEAFDPNLHEAVMHEAGDGGGAVVIETLRTGYRWHGRVLRAAMVKVRD